MSKTSLPLQSTALQRYLQRHIEPALPPPPGQAQWSNALVIPAYDEPVQLLAGLERLHAPGGRVLVILVLNRPANRRDASPNQPLRHAVQALPPLLANPPLYRLGTDADLLLYDLELIRGPTPEAQGVGLARKVGCDIALAWIAAGRVASDWIYNTDADATLPADYFRRAADSGATTVAATYPFHHHAGGAEAVDRATALYELRLHHYVLGLDYAGSPYAHHTLGSCLAVRALPYAQVRGFPRRSGAEDFYLLNKVAKLGPVARLGGACIGLRSRPSHRVPFGTGPAVQEIAASAQPAALPLFYHPACFEALRLLLMAAPELRRGAAPEIEELLCRQGLEHRLARRAAASLESLGWADGLDHCRRHGRSEAQFLRHFHQWFDGFRTLKFIHGLREGGWEDQSLDATRGLAPRLWPTAPAETGVEAARTAVARHWGWIRSAGL